MNSPCKKIEYSEITILIAVEMDNDGVCYSQMTIYNLNLNWTSKQKNQRS